MLRTRLGRASWALFVAIGLAVSGCDDPSPNMAFSLDDEGELHLMYRPCHSDARIFYVRLSANGDALWVIASTDGSTLREFTVGVAPDGFTEVMPLAKQIPDQHLRVTVSTSELRTDSEGFDPSNLETDRVLVPRRGLMTQTKFLLSDTCG